MQKVLLIIAVALALAAVVAAKGEAAAFCAYAGGRAGYENCGYYTWEQCLAATGGRGGSCMRNPHDPALWGQDRRGATGRVRPRR